MQQVGGALGVAVTGVIFFGAAHGTSGYARGFGGPIREYCVVSPFDTDDEGHYRTEVGWPVFHTHQP